VVEFRNDSSVLVVYQNLLQRGLSDARALAEHLVRRYWDGFWPEELLTVTDVVSVEHGTVLGAAAKGASIELRLNATVGTASMSAADLATTLAVTRKQNMAFEWIGPHLTPFFRVVRLRPRWLRTVKLDYAPPQRGAAALAVPIPPALLQDAQDKPSEVLETLGPEEQMAFVDTTV
jgi:hypothetical protein